MVLDASLLNTQQYKVGIKSKVEQCGERNSGVVAIEKGTFESPSTKVTNFTYFIDRVMKILLNIKVMISVIDREFEWVAEELEKKLDQQKLEEESRRNRFLHTKYRLEYS